MRPLLAVLVLCLLGCERPEVKPIVGELVVSPQALEFKDTFLGYPRDGEVLVNNRSRASRSLIISVTGPFQAVTELVAAGGSETPVTITFAPVEVGEATGTLTIGDANETLTTELKGTALQPPVCEATALCETSTFDPELGRCVAAQAEDGTSCGNACLTGACSSGRCVGTSLDCSDSNPCTVDACDPSVGCLHPPAECAAPVNPCKAALCDPTLGCVESDVRDGTACGPSDCVTAQVCIGGACKAAAVPDGAACGTESPCQARGTCQQSVCVRPPAGQLPLEWSYTFPGPHGSFRGVSDPAQNLYWVECQDVQLGPDHCEGCGSCAVVSYTSAGAVRFRSAVSAFTSAEPHHLLAGDALIYGWDGQVGALASATGARLWLQQLPLNLPGVGDVADAQVVTGLAAGPTGLTLTLERRQMLENRQRVLLQLDPATGVIIFAKFYDGALTTPVIDEGGTITFRVTPWSTPDPVIQPSFVVSLSPSGVERWRVTSSISNPWELALPIAVFQGELALDDGELRSMADGSRLAAGPADVLRQSPFPGDMTSHPVMSPTARILLRMAQSGTRVHALSLPPGGAQPTWEVLVHEMHGGNWLSWISTTSTGGFLVATGDTRHPTYLRAFDSAGMERFACELPTNPQMHMPAVLLDQRWAVLEPPYQLTPRLHVYEVPTERPAIRGWTGAHGSPSGANRPLP